MNVCHDGVRLHIKSTSILIRQTLSVGNARQFGENEKHLDLLMARKCGHFLPVSAKKGNRVREMKLGGAIGDEASEHVLQKWKAMEG